MAQTSELNSRPPIRLWPGVVAVTLQWLLIFGAPIVAPDLILYGMLGGVSLGLVILLWWLFFSRTPWSERIGAVVLIVVAVFAVSRLVHVSISNGMMGMMLPVFSIPVMCLALVAGVAASRGLPTGPRRAALAGAIVLGCLTLTLVRTGGIKGEGTADLHWRWTPTPEQRLLAQAAREKEAVTLPPAPADKQLPATTSDQPKAPKPAPVLAVAKIPEKINPAPAEAKTGADWSGFRGPERDSVIHGVRIETDWSRSKPVELWRRAIGPGWSSFAVHGDFFYTQEQRGEDELVSCYNLTTGAPVWRHSDATRFWESNGGAGPRGTPTFHNGRIYTFGATGMLNALDARDGTIVWSRNAAADTHKKIPMWGFASSPLVLGDSVIIATAGVLAAYDLATGNPRWIGPDGIPGDSFPEIHAAVGLSVAASERLFKNAPKSWPDVLRDKASSKPQSFALPLTLRMHEVSRHRAITSPNVIAVLPGSDPKLSQEYVVYSAHVDHLGIGKPINGDSIYNGAADDASGTAALLVLARAFKSLPQAPARSIMFFGATAEEKGLLGSDYFAHFPTVPIQSIAADINMDGASIFYTFNDIVAFGAEDSTLDAAVQRNASRMGLKVSPDPEPDQHYFVRADEYSFVRQGVPSLFISEGEEARDPKIDGKKFSEEWIATRYHAPSDDMNQPMDLDASVEFMQLDFLVGYDIAEDPQRPAWKPGNFFGENFGRK